VGDRLFLRIDGKWSLAWDEHQWILQKRQGLVEKGPRRGEEAWRGVSFVTSDRGVLARCMREKGVSVEAGAYGLAALPGTFQTFLRERRAHSGRFKASASACEPSEAPECHPGQKRVAEAPGGASVGQDGPCGCSVPNGSAFGGLGALECHLEAEAAPIANRGG
jgi:hypothetical protein